MFTFNSLFSISEISLGTGLDSLGSSPRSTVIIVPTSWDSKQCLTHCGCSVSNICFFSLKPFLISK